VAATPVLIRLYDFVALVWEGRGGEGRRKRTVVKWSTCHKYKQEERRKWRHDSYETTEVKKLLFVDFVLGSQNKGFF
jgi:hypothetical protein